MVDLSYVLQCCSRKLLDKDDKALEWYIYEEHEIGTGLLNSEVFKPLIMHNKVSKSVYEQMKRLGSKSKVLFESELERNADVLRSNSDWLEIYSLSDSIFQSIDW